MLRNLNAFNKRQMSTLVVFSIADFCNAMCVSLQAPFYPKEAELKGATATEYGFVFGIFELVVFFVSPFFGQNLNRIGPKRLFNGGIFTSATCVILFGLLDKVPGRVPFVTLSFLVRIVEALGNAAFLTASFAIIAEEFPDSVATTFASLETCFGLGLTVGPTIGGALYDVGGYTVPFVTLGSALLIAAVITLILLPSRPIAGSRVERPTGYNIKKILTIPGVLLATLGIVVTAMSIGFLSATLEPHLRQFNMSATSVGLTFIINGGTYALTAPLWGWLCDKKIRPRIASLLGSLLIVTGFSLIGPAPYFYFTTVFWVTCVGLVFHGLGIAALLVSSFTSAVLSSVERGFPNDINTYGLVSGLWTSTFALGAFIGPSMAGLLYDWRGFRDASLSIVLLGLVTTGVIIVFMTCSHFRKSNQESHEEQPEISGEINAQIDDTHPS